jgi:DNA-binding NtrC family response regulator
VDKAQDPDALRAAALVQRSAFRPLARVRYDLVGQDRALEQLFRVLSMQAQRLTAGPVVVMLCGPSGHGKTLVAQKCGHKSPLFHELN